MRDIPHFIDGKPFQQAEGERGDVFNPSTGEVQARVALGGPAVVDEAVTAARRSLTRR